MLFVGGCSLVVVHQHWWDVAEFGYKPQTGSWELHVFFILLELWITHVIRAAGVKEGENKAALTSKAWTQAGPSPLLYYIGQALMGKAAFPAPQRKNCEVIGERA